MKRIFLLLGLFHILSISADILNSLMCAPLVVYILIICEMATQECILSQCPDTG